MTKGLKDQPDAFAEWNRRYHQTTTDGPWKCETPEYFTVSKSQLAAAFAEWNRQYREHPEEFEEKGDNDKSGQVSAEFFIELLSEVEFPGPAPEPRKQEAQNEQ